MRATIINKAPEEWLRDLGTTPPKVAEILNSFQKGAPLRVCAYRAPHLFLRFHGSKAKASIFQPNYWVEGTAMGSAFGRASQFTGMLTDAEISRVAKSYYREITAICQNWNRLDDNELWKVQLLGTEVVEGLEGPIAPQPTFAATRTEASSQSSLPGGALQVYLYPRTPFICTPVDWNAL
jgi:hypothetical protein